MSTSSRPSFLRRLWPVALIGGVILGAYVLLLAYLGKLDEFSDHLDALSGIFVAFFTLVLLFIEHERDKREEARENTQRARIDQQASAIAFQISRQFVTWLKEVDAISPLAELENALAVLGEIGDQAYTNLVAQLLDWWDRTTASQNEAERRYEELVAIAPDASRHVANAVRHSFVKFYDLAGRWNHQQVVRRQGEAPNWREMVTGLKSLKTAAAALESAIDPQLRAVRDELTPLVSPIHDLAEALRRAFEENAPPGAGHV